MQLSLLPLLFGALAAPATAAPSPSAGPAATTQQNEVHIETGPGLPTLESLGITPAQLYDMTLEYLARTGSGDDSGSEHAKRWDDVCYQQTQNIFRPVGMRNLAACNVYLEMLDTTPCVVGPSPHETFMCRSFHFSDEQPAFVVGYAQGPPGSITSSWCRHVAHAVYKIGSTCPQFCYISPSIGLQCGVAGTMAAYGNGNLIVEVHS